MKTGDVVYLRASGVAMTVESRDSTHVTCVWFGINARADWTGPHRRRFRRAEVSRSLRQVEREQCRALRQALAAERETSK